MLDTGPQDAKVSKKFGIYGGLGRIRTPDPLIRSQVLYPTELPIRVKRDVALGAGQCKTEIDAIQRQRPRARSGGGGFQQSGPQGRVRCPILAARSEIQSPICQT